MIIKRKYEYFWRLVQRDPKSAELIRKACYNHQSESEGKRIFEYNMQNKAYQLEMGCGIKNPLIIINGFEELDEKEPYDNGFTIDDINDVNILNKDFSVDGEKCESIEISLLNKTDGYDYIVSVAKINK